MSVAWSTAMLDGRLPTVTVGHGPSHRETASEPNSPVVAATGLDSRDAAEAGSWPPAAAWAGTAWAATAGTSTVAAASSGRRAARAYRRARLIPGNDGADPSRARSGMPSMQVLLFGRLSRPSYGRLARLAGRAAEAERPLSSHGGE